MPTIEFWEEHSQDKAEQRTSYESKGTGKIILLLYVHAVTDYKIKVIMDLRFCKENTDKTALFEYPVIK